MHAVLIVLNARNVEDHTDSNTIETWHGVAKLTRKPTCPDLKQGKASPSLTNLNVSTVKKTTLLTTPDTHSRNTNSTENGTPRKPRSSEKSKLTQFAYFWAVINYKY